MWLGAAGVKAFNFYYESLLGVLPPDNNIAAIFQLHSVQKFFVILMIGALLALIFHPLKEIFGKKYALLAIFFMMLEPFYIALTRMFHLEGLMSTLMIASFVWLYYYFWTRRRKHLIISALFAATAFLTKTSAVFLIPFSALIIFIENFVREKNFRAATVGASKTFILWMGVVAALFILIWPAMWTHARLALGTLYRGIFTIGVERGHFQLFMGNWVADPGWLFYPLVILYRISLPLFIGLLAFLITFRKFIKSREMKLFIIYALLFSVFYLVELSIPSKKLDRYILPAILALILIASFYFRYLFDYLNGKIKYLGWLATVGVVVYFLITALYLHPNYFSYYSPLFGGLSKGIYVIEPKWMLGQQEIISYFQKIKMENDHEAFLEGQSVDEVLYTAEIENKLTIGFQEKYYTQIWPFIEEIGGRATIKDLTPMAIRTNYFVYPVYEDDSANEGRFELEFLDTIKLRHVDLYNVYQRVK